MLRAFRIGILKFLREHEATTAVIDIKNPFLSELNTVDKRKAFKQALDTLSNEKLIVVSGSYDFLNWKLINGLYPINDKIIEAKITAKGLTYEQPAEIIQNAAAEPEPPLDMPLPPAIKALSTLFKGTKGVTEQRLKSKMKKMGAKESHLKFEKKVDDEEPVYHTKHVSVVPNPFIDDTLHTNDEAAEDFDPLSRISLQGKASKAPNPKAIVINKLLKWIVIIISIILVGLIVLIFKANS
jgi:hypothetical protein